MQSIFIDLVQRYASRKFLIPVGFAVLLFYNHQSLLGIDNFQFLLLGVLCAVFIWQEGEADTVERSQG